MKEKIKNINQEKVLKTFVKTHVLGFLTLVVLAVLAELIGVNPANGIPDTFSIFGVFANFITMAVIFYITKRFALRQPINGHDTGMLVFYVFIFGLVLYFVVNQFNILAYYFILLVPIVAAHYFAKRKNKQQ